MIQVNLIPDLKAEFLKAQRTKRFVMGISFLVSAGFIAVLIVMYLYVNVWQQSHTNSLNADIQSLSAQYQNIEDLDKIITVQNQLSSLPGLHADKPLVSRLVTYLSVLTPEGVTYQGVDLRFEDSTVELLGSAPTTADVNVIANTVKNAVYTVGETPEGEEPDERLAFSNVVLETLSRDLDVSSFSIRFEFDETIFTEKEEVVLSVPVIDSTNSELNRPDVDNLEIFQIPSEDN